MSNVFLESIDTTDSVTPKLYVYSVGNKTSVVFFKSLESAQRYQMHNCTTVMTISKIEVFE